MAETYRFIRTGTSSNAQQQPGYFYDSSTSVYLSKVDLDGKEVVCPTGTYTFHLDSHPQVEFFMNHPPSNYDNYCRFNTWRIGTLSNGVEVTLTITEHPDMPSYMLKPSHTFSNSEKGKCKPILDDAWELAPPDLNNQRQNFENGDIVKVTTPFESYEIQITEDGDLSSWIQGAKANYRHILSEQLPKEGESSNRNFYAPFKMEKVGSVLEGGGGEATNLLKVGDTPISTAFVADTAVSKIYAGNTLVFGAGEGGGGQINPGVEVVAQDEGSWIDGTFTKIYDITNTGDVDLFVVGGLRVPEGYKLTPNETIQSTYTSVEEGKEDRLFLEFRIASGFLFKRWEEVITTPPFAWTAGVYPTKEGEFRFYRITGGMIYMTFANVPDVGWTEGKDYQINHSKLGDLGTNTLLDIQVVGNDVRLGFLDNGSWGTEGNGIFEVGTTMTLEKSPLLIEEEFGYNSSTPAVGNIYASTNYFRLNTEDAKQWEAALEIGCDAIVSIVGKEGSYTRRYFMFDHITKMSTYWSFYFDSYQGSMSNSGSYRYAASAYKRGRLPE